MHTEAMIVNLLLTSYWFPSQCSVPESHRCFMGCHCSCWTTLIRKSISDVTSAIVTLSYWQEMEFLYKFCCLPCTVGLSYWRIVPYHSSVMATRQHVIKPFCSMLKLLWNSRVQALWRIAGWGCVEILFYSCLYISVQTLTLAVTLIVINCLYLVKGFHLTQE